MEESLEKACSLLKDIGDKCKDATSHVKALCKKAENGDFNTSKGISFLEVKYQLLLSYLINLTYVMLKKARGESIKGEPSIKRLVEVRTVLEKMRPIDQKLKYQVDKVIRLATTGTIDSNDPMRFKANPDSLASKLDGEESDSGSGSESDDEKKSNIYRPPKLSAMHYDGDETVEDKRQKQVDSLRKRALNSDLMQELKDQYYEGPQEIRESRDIHRMKADKSANDRQRYEEDHFVRLSVSRKDKHSSRKMATVSSLNNLTQFDSLSGLDLEAGATMEDIPSKKRKLAKGNKGGKKGKKSYKRRR